MCALEPGTSNKAKIRAVATILTSLGKENGLNEITIYEDSKLVVEWMGRVKGPEESPSTWKSTISRGSKEIPFSNKFQACV
jgi:ribonuclease HI